MLRSATIIDNDREPGGAMSHKLLLVLAMMIGAAGCTGQLPATAGPTATGSEPSLIDSDWLLTGINGAAPLADSTITLSFGDDGRVTGSSGCNRYFGGYRQMGAGQLEIGPLAGTRMYCPGVLGEQEGRYLSALQATTTYTLDNQLRLSHPGGILVFDPAS